MQRRELDDYLAPEERPPHGGTVGELEPVAPVDGD
jgi:hypothetical protein